jgi:hypothetical protein
MIVPFELSCRVGLFAGTRAATNATMGGGSISPKVWLSADEAALYTDVRAATENAIV